MNVNKPVDDGGELNIREEDVPELRYLVRRITQNLREIERILGAAPNHISDEGAAPKQTEELPF